MGAAKAADIPGISAYFRDSATALPRDGELVAAAQQGRFSRNEHEARLPRDAVSDCLAAEGLRLAGLDRKGPRESGLVTGAAVVGILGLMISPMAIVRVLGGKDPVQEASLAPLVCTLSQKNTRSELRVFSWSDSPDLAIPLRGCTPTSRLRR
jgi:hypothetical protein